MRSFLLSLAFLMLSAQAALAAPLGNYASIACDQAYFTANSCDQCFDGGSIEPGTRIEGLYDTWTNASQSEQVARQSEQVRPEIISLGGTAVTWTSVPADPVAFWKFGSDILWTGNPAEFTLDAGKTAKIFEADLGAHWLLDRSTAAVGTPIGLGRFPVVYHQVDAAGNEGAAETHYECVVYRAAGATAVVPVPERPITQVQTGPAETAFIMIALLLAAGIAYFRRRQA